MAPFEALYLVIWANAAPVVAQLFLRDRWNAPVDGGARFRDGRPWLGTSKTWRGWATCVITTPLAGWLIGLPWQAGLVAALAAMLGDCAASFVKRRFNFRSGASAIFVDQIPESLLPALALRGHLPLTDADVAMVIGGFFVVHRLLTPVVLRLRRRPGSSYG